MAVDAGSWFETTATGDEEQLVLVGVLDGWEADDVTPIITPLVTSVVPIPTYKTPAAPTLTGSMTTSSTSTINWVPAVTAPADFPATTWWLGRNHSLDNGTTWQSSWTPVGGSPHGATVRTANDTGIPVQASPAVLVRYRCRGENAYGYGAYAYLNLQWQGNPDTQPTAPINFSLSGTPTTTTRAFSWELDTTAPSPAVTKFGIFEGDTLRVDSISSGLRTATWSGLTAEQTYTDVNVRRWNGEWSPASNKITFTQPKETVSAMTMLIGVSDGDTDHGGTQDWEGWRSYNRSNMMAHANASVSGWVKPLFIAYSEQGENLGWNGTTTPNDSYATVKAHVIAELNAFYYGDTAGTAGTGTGSTQSRRWGIKLFWSNGNENYDKALLRPTNRAPGSVSAANIAAYVATQRGLYEACHYIDPATGSRRFPDAYAGSNPTHEMENSGIVAEALHPSAQYHDFVMWSMYPPGRKASGSTGAYAGSFSVSNPRYDWPSFNVADRGTQPVGFLIRCFYRTKEAQKVAQDPTSPYYSGKTDFPMMIGVGEWGIGDAGFNSLNNAASVTTPAHIGTAYQRAQYRPYYAVHGMYGAVDKLSVQFDLPVPFTCWWDQQKKIEGTRPQTPTAGNWDPNSPENLLGEGYDRDNNLNVGENSNASPTTREVIQNWKAYDHRQTGGTHPASWSHITRANLDDWGHLGTPVYPPT